MAKWKNPFGDFIQIELLLEMLDNKIFAYRMQDAFKKPNFYLARLLTSRLATWLRVKIVWPKSMISFSAPFIVYELIFSLFNAITFRYQMAVTYAVWCRSRVLSVCLSVRPSDRLRLTAWLYVLCLQVSVTKISNSHGRLGTVGWCFCCFVDMCVWPSQRGVSVFGALFFGVLCL